MLCRTLETPEMVYAGDVVVFEKLENLQRNFKILHVELQKEVIKINKKKLKTLIIGTSEKTHRIRIDKEMVEQIH